MDDNKTTFRNKVKSQFSPQITKPKVSSKGKETVKSTFISSLLPPILAKSQKEINKISKYFKKNNTTLPNKSYTQALSTFKKTSSILLLDIIRDMLKIKEMFSNLSNTKINLV